MKIFRVGPKVPPHKAHESGLGPWGPHHFSKPNEYYKEVWAKTSQTTSLLKKRVSVIKEKGSHRKSGL